MKRARAGVSGDDGRRQPHGWTAQDVERLCGALGAFSDLDDPQFFRQVCYLMGKRLGRFAVPYHADPRSRILALAVAIDRAQERERAVRALADTLRFLRGDEAAMTELEDIVAELAPESRLSAPRLQEITEYLDTMKATMPLVVAHAALHRALLPGEPSGLRGTEDLPGMVHRLNDAKEPATAFGPAEPLVLRFLAELAAAAPKDTAEVLRSHLLLTAHELGLPPDARATLIGRPDAVPAQADRRVLQIRLDEHAPGTQQYTLEAALFDWTDDGLCRPLRRGGDRVYTVRELQQCGRTCLVEWEDLVIGLDAADHAHVEFLLPWSLLAHPVERWLTDDQGYLLGHKYPVVVRSLDRIRRRSWHRDWRRRWAVLQDSGEPDRLLAWLALNAPSALEEHGDVLYLRGRDGEVRAWLDDHPDSAGIALAFAYDHRDPRSSLALREAVCEGVAFMVWRRDDGDPAELAERLRESAHDRFADLPARLRQWRRGVPRDDEADMHNHLTLFWDDPDCVHREGPLSVPGTEGSHAVSPAAGPRTRGTRT
ncbi:hypothetical protein AB0I00_13600 [Streptomyces sp. NPDC050803]|uniref:VMAP-C domain-containing protein n=1 Tax=unclassified Streptomyces TaxID=2593676 RepID=UPI003416FFEB